MITIGLTGGIATGKSTVADILRKELSVPVIDADQVSRHVVEPGRPALAEIVHHFGVDMLTPTGELDRKALGAVVMGNDEARAHLERITHPRIREEIEARLTALEATGAAVAVVEAALMVETGSYALYDRLLVVSCEPQRQLHRLMQRNHLNETTARAWISSQLPLEDKERLAHAVIRNDGDRDALTSRTLEVWHTLEF
ncbi:MAG: dephospho-CoA kinase [Deltaproteobacteria bacterium]|nr:dephospho-CoA kinase [Deltaproteobacteria bacterium]